MPKYEFINASDAVLSFPSEKGEAMVQPNTRRVLEIDEEFSDRRIENYASSGVFVKKSGAAAENGKPMSEFDPDIADARNRLMVAAGQERDDIVAELRGEKKATRKSTGGEDPAGASPAPSAAPTPTAAAAAGATTGGAGATTTAGRG